MLNDKLYNVLKFIAQIGLPALGTFWTTISGLWGWPNTEEVVGTIIALDLLLGALLSLSTRLYNNSDEKYDAELHLVETAEGPKLHLADVKPDLLSPDRKEALVKVVQ